MQGRVHSFQSLGTVDGPGIRAVVFMQGCPLRCVCCHNPDTWDISGGSVTDTQALFDKIVRLRSYFGKDGGVTVSGGEPLMQADFVRELFEKCHAAGINCALDTSGYMYNESVEALLAQTDLVLLDYKYSNEGDYAQKCGCDKAKVDLFLQKLEDMGKRVWIRHVLIPTLNDNVASLRYILSLKERYRCIEKIELLPFRKLCVEKYQSMGISFPLIDVPEADEKMIEKLREAAT